ncbi:predicted protein [Postia placenta Mad-698-R]|uniref:Uncharacterized protein n=1 Tax=Postia placenta MAD-698-R-SB12 TaxID=670580 RepID=A0A1X6NE37_9APHY|nr:hypothetical protein POSPLADRAFT_1051015 [Postia placenta MAD-698-R-SB12]EED79641.1 predicted protein [Postia placenta Mad-698-R]OSX66844.1 hypothetical protein POSPLADRAFT_1051015 [Postia placenta MAD-698-R-SB12]
MFAHLPFTTLGALALAMLAQANLSSHHRRSLTGQSIAFACYGGGGDCECPPDLTGGAGTLINVYPGFQCAYKGGACTWDDKTGALQNVNQTNCPTKAACSTSSGCECPTDLNNNTGVLVNQFAGYQCVYTNGACTWNAAGVLQNTGQTNCPTNKTCSQLAGDS